MGDAFNGHPEITPDDVQNAVDDADGRHDGDIVHEPETDVQQILHALAEGAIDEGQAFVLAIRVVGERTDLRGSAADWAALAKRLGPEVLAGAVKVGKLLWALAA